MSPVAQRARRRSRKKTKTSIGWRICLPLLVGIAVTPVAVWGASVLAMSGPSALRLLYPFVTLTQRFAAHSFAPNQAETLSQWVMYGQFPVYGLVWMMMRRLRSGATCAVSILLLHAGAVVLAMLTAAA